VELQKDHAMTAIVIEHVPVAQLPPEWRVGLALGVGATVTVRIEEETPDEGFATDDPLFGMWSDREDMADVAGYIRSARASRFNDDGTPRQK
jgi:hypothetical protein